ncbi:MAG: hypothetical protein P8Y68_20150, partial [Anaerolineales bacterium]
LLKIRSGETGLSSMNLHPPTMSHQLALYSLIFPLSPLAIPVQAISSGETTYISMLARPKTAAALALPKISCGGIISTISLPEAVQPVSKMPPSPWCCCRKLPACSKTPPMVSRPVLRISPWNAA